MPQRGTRGLTYSDQIKNVLDNPGQLERLYQNARQAGNAESFQEEIFAAYQDRPDDILLSAWYHRLKSPEPKGLSDSEASRPWAAAIASGLATGLVLWAVSDPALTLIDDFPYFILLWAPIAAVFAMGFLVLSDTRRFRRAVIGSLAVAIATLYVFLVAPIEAEVAGQTYLIITAFHLPLLSYAAVGATLVGLKDDPRNRFAYLSKSLEVFITAGLFGITGVIALQISYGMFDTQGLVIPEWALRLIVSMAAGVLPLLAIVTSYDPALEPSQQDFSKGISRLIATIMHVVLPVVCGIMLIYVLFIPFTFWGPFENRQVLIVYNVMLFAIMALLVGAVPVKPALQSERVSTLVRRGVVVVTALAALIGIYALSAVIYRTIEGGITPNRLTVIGWNIINIVTLTVLAVKQTRAERENWTSAIHDAFSLAAYAYISWGLFVVVITPLLFRT